MFLVLVLLFIVLPIAEIYVIVKVGETIGAWWTILLLIADSLIGAQLLRWQGRTAWRRFQEAIQGGRMPHREILDGALIIVGGAFLLTPGFISDVFGVLLLLPPTRALARRAITRFLTPGSMARVTFVRSGRGHFSDSASGPPPRHVDQPPPRELPRG